MSLVGFVLGENVYVQRRTTRARDQRMVQFRPLLPGKDIIRIGKARHDITVKTK